MQLEDVCAREMDRLDLAGLTLSQLALPLRGVGVVPSEAPSASLWSTTRGARLHMCPVIGIIRIIGLRSVAGVRQLFWASHPTCNR